jgi:hypothetical protein
MLAVSTRAQVSFGEAQKINERWEFFLGDKAPFDVPVATVAPSTSFGGYGGGGGDRRSPWRMVDLPHDWSVEGTLNPSLAACTGYLPGGIAWYRKKLDIPEALEGKKVYIYFEGVQNRSEVYLNGQLLGKRPNGYVSFLYDMTPHIVFGGDNLLTVRVDHSRYADSRWYNGSGIYRNVWLVTANPVHVAPWGVFAYTEKATEKSAELAVEVEVVAEQNLNKVQNLVKVAVEVQLIDKDGKIVATKKDSPNKKIKLKVSNPHLWNLETPCLYTLKTTLTENGKVIDESTVKTGLRIFTFDPDKGFSLNGNRMKMKGLCIHHDAGVLGAAVPREVWERRLLTLKSLGCNAIRLTHNLHNPDVYELCDEMGLLVMDEVFDEWEFPKRKWVHGWNVGEPGFDGGADYFNEWSSRDLADGVKRDRNHPSLFAWSIGNEVDYPNDPYSHPVLDGGNAGFTQKAFGGYKPDAPDANCLGAIAKRLTGVIKALDRSRPVTAGLAGVAMSNETEYPYVLDITGYNYTENRYQSDHKTYPKRVIYGSENRHDMAAWKAVRDNEHIFGQFLWTGIDYLGESGVWPARGFYSGLLDFAGFIKSRGMFRKALWTDDPTIYLGTYQQWGGGRNRQPSMDAWPVWNYEEGQNVAVVCYTNARKAQLFLNNQPVGEMKDYDDETGIIAWEVPYKPGVLSVKGYDADGKETCEYRVQTSQAPSQIALKACSAEISKERGVAQIEVRLLDKDGIPAALADNNILCRVEGPGKLLGLEAGDNTDMGNYRDPQQRAFRGRLLAYVEAIGEGDITVSFSSPYLKPASIKIIAH